MSISDNPSYPRNSSSERGAAATLLVFVVICGVLGFCVFAPGRPGLSKPTEIAKTKRVLLIGIDGCRADALHAANIPHLRQLIQEGCLLENTEILGPRETGSDTVSGPGWSSILTGVWADKHGVVDNTFSQTNYKHYPDFFKRIRDRNSHAFTVSLSDWPPLYREIVQNASLSESFDDPPEDDYATHDEQVTKRACKLMSERNPKAMFVYLGNVDETGHRQGFHPSVKPYVRAIEKVDEQIGRILETLRSRPTLASENWLIIVCTDHGGRLKDHANGHGFVEVRRVFLILSGPSAPKSLSIERTQIVDIVPTLLDHLGIAIDEAWRLDGQSLLQPRLPVSANPASVPAMKQ